MKIEESFIFGSLKSGDSLSNLKLPIVTVQLPGIGNSITNITMDTEKSCFSEHDIKFCSNLFSSFSNLQTISLQPKFWFSCKDQKQISKLFCSSKKTLPCVKLIVKDS